MDARIFRINYKSDFIITLESDAGWATPFCIKFWTDSPQRAFYVQYDGETYTHCAPVAGEPTKLTVQMDDHHLGVGDLKYQIAYHFTVADFPNDTEDEVLNQAAVIINEDGQQEQVMLDLNGETAPEIAFSLPAYANEAQRIANEQQRIANEEQRIANETQRIANEEQRINKEQQRITNENQRIANEEARVAEFARLKRESEAATQDANEAAVLATTAADLATAKAQLAQDAATLANQKAQLAADKAALAAAAADLATAKAQLAQEKATYAQTQGDYAKARGTIAEADHVRAESDHTRAESDHAAVEVYVDSLGAFDISSYHATGGVLAKYAYLTAALGTNGANIPDALRKGGMSVKYAQSSDNKYVQYFLTKNEWSVSETDWEKMNLEEDVNQLSQKLDFIPSTEHIGYLTSNGTYSMSSEYHSLTTVRIKCVPGDKFMYRGVGRSSAISALFYSNNVIISSLQVNSQTQFSEIVIPDGIDEVCFSSFNELSNEIILNVYHESQVISEINEDISEITSGIYGTILSNVKVSKQELSFIPVNINKGDYFQVKINVSGITRFIINYNENNNNRLFDTRDMSKVGVWLNFYAPTNLTYIGYWLDVSKGTTLSVKVGGTITELRGEVLSSDTKVLHGKIGVSFGDSIMRGNGNNNRGPLDLLISDYQCDGTNYAVGGATCAENSGRSHIVAQIQEAIAAQISPDFILLNGGSNDILYSQLGTLTDSYDYVTKGYATYTDGLEYCFGLLKDTFPSVPILFMLPHSTPSRNYTTEQQFLGRAREICKKWSIPIADIEQDGNLNTRISTQLTAFADEGGTHPNGAGYQYAYIPLIVTKLKQIFGYRITQ